MEQTDQDRTEQRSWFARLHLSWPMLLLAGWLMYEFTSEPGLAALVACAKFAWSDVRTAFWLRRVDPDRMRGQACFWAYLAYGLWKVAILATLSMIVLGFISVLVAQMARPRQANNDFSPVLAGALAAALFGFGLSFPLAYVATWSALRNGVRLWLGHAPNRARKERFWPPRHTGINAAPFVGFTCLVLTMWFIVFAFVSLAVLVQPGGVGCAVFWVITLLTMFVLPILFFRKSAQVIARSPQECWALEEEEVVYQASGPEESVNEI